METLHLLSAIEEKIKKLKARNERLEKDNAELKKSVFEYLQKMETQKKEFDKSKTQMLAMQMGKSSSLDHTQLRKELDHYIHLIDKCIASVHVK